MTDVGTPSAKLIEKLRVNIQDLNKYNELESFELTLEAPDIQEALIGALEEYNDILIQTQYTFESMDRVRLSYFMRMARAYAYEMMYTRKLTNSVAYSDGGFSVNESATLSFFKALFENTHTLATRQITRAKNNDSINDSFLGGVGMEY